MKRILTAMVAFCLLASLDIQAGVLQVGQWMPWSFVKNELIKNSINVNVNEDELSMSLSELTPEARGLQLSIQGNYQELKLNALGISGISNNLRAEISIQELSINQYLVKNFGGNIIRVLIQAKCTPIKISIPQFSVRVESMFQEVLSSYRPELSQLEILIPQNSWSMNRFECSGIGGLGSEIANTVTQALNNPQTLQKILLGWLKVQIQNQWSATWNSLLASNENIQLQSMGLPSDKGVMIYGSIGLKNSKIIALNSINESTLSSTHPQFIISSEGFSALLEDRFTTLAPQKYNLQNVQGFADLMKSKLKQFLVWPDLQRFPSYTPFLLSYIPPQSRFIMRASGLQKWLVKFNTNGVLQTLISQAPIDYMNWGLGLTTEMSCEVKGSVLKLKTGKTQLEVAWVYGPLYQMIYRPNQRIALSLLKGVMESSFSNQVVTQNLPILKYESREWKLQNWSQNNQLITMDWIEESI